MASREGAAHNLAGVRRRRSRGVERRRVPSDVVPPDARRSAIGARHLRVRSGARDSESERCRVAAPVRARAASAVGTHHWGRVVVQLRRRRVHVRREAVVVLRRMMLGMRRTRRTRRRVRLLQRASARDRARAIEVRKRKQTRGQPWVSPGSDLGHSLAPDRGCMRHARRRGRPWLKQRRAHGVRGRPHREPTCMTEACIDDGAGTACARTSP